MESTWENRDLPVLEAAVRYFEEHRMRTIPQAYDLAPMVGLDAEDVGLALSALGGEYLRVEFGLRNAMVKEIYPAARRAVGQWPTPERLAERIVETLNQAAEEEPDEEANKTSTGCRNPRLRRARSVHWRARVGGRTG